MLRETGVLSRALVLGRLCGSSSLAASERRDLSPALGAVPLTLAFQEGTSAASSTFPERFPRASWGRQALQQLCSAASWASRRHVLSRQSRHTPGQGSGSPCCRHLRRPMWQNRFFRKSVIAASQNSSIKGTSNAPDCT